jgi:branched-subunit amino acid transport protein
MDPALKLWTVIVVVGALNYFSRLSFIAFFSRRAMPKPLARALKFVPAAMLTALIVPMVLPVPPTAIPLLLTPKIVAAIVASIVAFATRSTVATLGVGMGLLWLLQAAYPRIG